MNKNSLRGFTLVELLVVVAIIAILAAIAIPNLLGAQTRSKVARVKSDLRTLAGALQAYRSDHNSYPLGNEFGLAGARAAFPGDPPVLERLSTPLAYLTNSFLPSPFEAMRRSGPFVTGIAVIDTDFATWPANETEGPDGHLYRTYLYYSTAENAANASGIGRVVSEAGDPEHKTPTSYIIQCAGPMRSNINMGGVIANSNEEYSVNLLYDPTNGSVSFGNIFRWGGQKTGQANFFSALGKQD